MKTKKLSLITAIFISILTGMTMAPLVMADEVTVHWVGGYYDDDVAGGEFTLTPTGSLAAHVDLYHASTKNIGNYDPSFQSFCVEYGIYLNPNGGTYTAILNDEAVQGSIGSKGDPISVGTAWLYHQFQEGVLEGYDYDTTDGDRSDSSGALQIAIWWLEQEGGYSYDPSNPFMWAVVNKFGNTAAARADNNGQYLVGVLNLYNSSGDPRQDQLICIPTPEPTTMFLLGSGLLGLAGMARRRFKK
jgi:hypothetical protein